MFADSRMNYTEVCFGIDDICKTSPIILYLLVAKNTLYILSADIWKTEPNI